MYGRLLQHKRRESVTSRDIKGIGGMQRSDSRTHIVRKGNSPRSSLQVGDIVTIKQTTGAENEEKLLKDEIRY